jgi:Flp pilus assembly protein TadG
MTTQETAAMQPTPDRRRERGQILVIFVIAIFAIIGMVGLVLDGGSTFAQRRDQQNVADLASVAGATAYLNQNGAQAAKTNAAINAAHAVATANGYTTNASTGVSVNVSVSVVGQAADVTVDLTKPHQNTFVGVLGMGTWGVGVTATARSSEYPNGAYGAMPLLFNSEAFPGAVCDEDAGNCVPEIYNEPGTGNEDVPQDATQFNWTIFCTANGNPCNADSSGVDDLIDHNGTDTTIYLNDEIGPLNAGSHTTLFDDLGEHAGELFPVPIVNDDGAMVGWAYFRLLDVEGSSEKVIRGYFVSPVNGSALVVKNGGGDASVVTGAYSVRLTN